VRRSRKHLVASAGLALLLPACVIFAILPWVALACAAAACALGCGLHRHRSVADTGLLHLCRIVLLAGGAMVFMAALVATGSPLAWVVVLLSTLPILPAYAIGFYGLSSPTRLGTSSCSG
jgi:hypothetical protein